MQCDAMLSSLRQTKLPILLIIDVIFIERGGEEVMLISTTGYFFGDDNIIPIEEEKKRRGVSLSLSLLFPYFSVFHTFTHGQGVKSVRQSSAKAVARRWLTHSFTQVCLVSYLISRISYSDSSRTLLSKTPLRTSHSKKRSNTPNTYLGKIGTKYLTCFSQEARWNMQVR